MNTKAIADQAAEDDALTALTIGGGGVIGRAHRRAGRGSQDGFAWVRGPRSLVGVVCDGCGSGAHSEVGAALGARLFATALAKRLDAGAVLADPAPWREARAEVLGQIAALARAMAGGGDVDAVIVDYFLFTIVGVAATPTRTAIFAVGDGAWAVDGRVQRLGPFPDNQPPYLAYDLLGIANVAPGEEIVAELATDAFGSLLVATDGASDLSDDELAALAADAAVVRNPDGPRRRLALLARDEVIPDWDQRRLRRSGGRLGDDTTVLIVCREAAP